MNNNSAASYMLSFFDVFDFFSNEMDTSGFQLLFNPREKDCWIDRHSLEPNTHFDTTREVFGGNPAILGYEGLVPNRGVVGSIIIVFGCFDHLLDNVCQINSRLFVYQ